VESPRVTYDPFKNLKTLLRRKLENAPRGTQRRIAEVTGIPEPSISEFKTTGLGLELENLAGVARCFGIEITVALKKTSKSPLGRDLKRHTSGITLPATASVLYKAGANAPDDVDARVRQLTEENDYLRSVLATFDERCDQTKADIADSLAFRAGPETRTETARPRQIHPRRGHSSAS
jgi:hypothetical protein